MARKTVATSDSPTPAATGEVPQAQEESRRPANVGTFHSLRYFSYRMLWIGSLFSSAGQWIQQTTLGWLVYDMTGSSALLGAVNGMRALPMLLVSPFAGVAADHYSNKRIMQYSQVFLMIASLALAMGLLLHAVTIWMLFVFTFLTGVAWAMNQPVRQSVVFQIVPRHAVPNAIALNGAAFNFTRVLGPAAAGLLITWLGPSGNFFVQSAMYVGVSISIGMMVIPPLVQPAQKRSVGNEMAEGFKYVANDPATRALMMMGLFPVLLAMPYSSLMPVFAKDVFHGGASSYGFLLSMAGLGGLLGGLTTASLGRFERRGLMQLVAMIFFGLGLVGLGFVHNIVLAAGLLVVIGFSQMMYQTTNQALLQMSVPDHLRSRVTAIFMLNQGLLPLGTLFAGVAAEFIGAPAVVFVMGISCIVVALAVVVSVPRVRDLRLSEITAVKHGA